MCVHEAIYNMAVPIGDIGPAHMWLMWCVDYVISVSVNEAMIIYIFKLTRCLAVNIKCMFFFSYELYSHDVFGGARTAG